MSRGIAFPPRIGPDGRVAWSSGAQNVRESIQIILQTNLQERIMRPNFGGGLEPFLYESNTLATRTQIEEHTRRALARWEPRAAVDEVSAEAVPDEPSAVELTIAYTVRDTDTREQVRLTVDLGG
ncbi:MAG: GPW/gp25 family protein [Salinibacter sp.]|uniref:GPW/gp25 family protein n=1 Tax=Salinibacter sp. TaxID=2065818 RepID=UPI002FC2DC4E